MLKFIKSFFQRFSKSNKVNNATVNNSATLLKPKEKIKIVHKSSNIHKTNNVSTHKKHKLLKSKIETEIKSVHIHVNKKDNIIVKFFSKNGIEFKNKERRGKYSDKLLDHYKTEFSSFQYEVQIYNHLVNKNNKQKITISPKRKKTLRKTQQYYTSDSYEIGYIKWFNDEDRYGFIKSRQDIDFYVNKRELSGNVICENDIVIFIPEKGEKGNFAKQVFVLTNNRKSLIKFIEFNDKYRDKYKSFFTSKAIKTFCQSFLKPTYIYDLPEQSFVNLLHENNLNSDAMHIIDDYITKNKTINVLLEKVLITHLSNDNVIYILKSKNLNLFLNNPKIIGKLNTLSLFIINKHEKWIALIKKAMNYKHENVMFNPSLIYNDFSDTDYLLAKQWTNNSDNKFEYAKMLSARGAELAALNFYKTLNFNVSDTAMTQVDRSSEDWKWFDLLLDNTKSVDVKNSRGVINERLSYSEHCIPRFKNNRHGQGVIISGVISPYLKMQEDEDKLDCSNLYGSSELENSIVLLGETTVEMIEKLYTAFSKDILTIDRDKQNFVPDWLLEYPKEFYKEREDLKTSFISICIEHPTMNEYKMLDIKAIPFFLSCGIDLPSNWKKLLTNYQLDFYNRLKPKCNLMITKPYLYLAILKHFIEKLQSEQAIEYHPLEYIEILYYDDEYMYPLGIYDPTQIIKKLIYTLDELWKYRDQVDLEDYVTFKYTEKGMLKAKKTMTSPWNTLLAYCGGRIEGKGPCGYKPLIKGLHETCNVCGNIICPKCDFCKKDYLGTYCAGIEERRLNEQTYL